MKKINYLFSALALGAVLLTSCSKSDDEEQSMTPVNADKTITLNSVSNPTEKKDTLYIKRDKNSVVITANAITSTGIDLRRVYVYKRSSTVSQPTQDYVTYNGSGSKKDGNNNYYYEIATDQRNNTSLTLTVPVSGQSNPNAIFDEYAFYYTSNSNFNMSTDDPLLGPAQFFIVFGKLDETTGHRINNVNGPNPAAFDLRSLVSKSKTDVDADKDMADTDYSSTTMPEFEGRFTSLNETRFVSVPSTFDYTNATDLSIKAAYTSISSNILTPAFATSPVVAINQMYIAKIRGGSGVSDYALIRVTGYVPETDPAQTGAGKNNEYIEFSVKKQ